MLLCFNVINQSQRTSLIARRGRSRFGATHVAVQKELNSAMFMINPIVSVARGIGASFFRKAMSTQANWPALVSVEWLDNARKQPDLRILDGSWHMPAWQRDPIKEFHEKHIPNAQFFDLDECADKKSSYDHMLPSKEDFAAYVGQLGIGNDTNVVVYDNNAQFGLFSAQRVWWMFRVFGHTKISVLNGGLPKWIEAGLKTTTEVAKVAPQKYTATYVAELVRSIENIEENIKTQKCIVVDARPAGRFEGTMAEPRPEIKPGHIVNSTSIPFAKMLDPDSKLMKSPKEVVEVFKNASVSLEKDSIIASCGSGVTACMLVMAAYTAGRTDLPVYDGAWTEFFLRAKPENKVLPELVP